MTKRQAPFLLAALALAGGVAAVAQVVLLRQGISTLSGNELGLGLGLLSWLLWTGAGSLLAGRFLPHARPLIPFLASLASLSLLLPLTVLAFLLARPLAGLSTGQVAGLPEAGLAYLLLLAPFGTVNGLCFGFGAAALGHPGRAFAAESAGAAAGGVLFTFAGGTLVPGEALALGMGWVGLALVAVAAFLLAEGRERLRADAFLAGCALLLGATQLLVRPARELRWEGYSVRERRESLKGSLTWAEASAADQGVLFYDGSPLFAFPDPRTAEEAVHPALLLHPRPARVLLVSTHATGVLEELLRHPVETVDLFLPDREVAELELRRVPSTARSLADPRVTLVPGDLRSFLRRREGPPYYDVILLSLPDPSTLLFNRFYTAEFFSLARSRLSAEGILALSLGEPANYLSRTQGAYLAAVDRALEPSFPSRVFHPLGRYLVAAGPSRATLLAPEQAGRMASERGLTLQFVTPEELSPLLTPDRMRMAVRVMRASGIRANTDRRPRAVLHRLAQWGEMTGPSTGSGRGWEGAARWMDSRSGQRAGVGAILLLAAGLGWLALRPAPGRRASTVLLLGGAAGMAAELTILYQAQVTLGTVYGLMSVFFALFMGGAAYGGFLEVAPPRRVAAEWAALFTVLALLPFMVAPGLTLLLPLMAVGGYLTGRSYRCGAGLLQESGAANPAAAAYALDLGGAAVGAVLAGLLLPFTLGVGGGVYLGLALAGGVLLALGRG